jgi:hypothetical protein
MILDNEITINVNPANDRTYYKLGYYDKEIVQEPLDITIKIDDLNKSSRMNINVRCDICSNDKKITYYKYIDNIKQYGFYCCSPKCASVKNKLTCLEKYGNVNFNNREKAKSTCIEKYGEDNVQKNTEINKKSIETRKKDNGYSKIFEKVHNKLKEKYGKTHALQVEELFTKSKKTKLARYNDENYNNRDKSKLTSIERYGEDNIQKTTYIIEKRKQDVLSSHPDILSISDDHIYTIKCDLGKEHHFEILPEQYYQRCLSKTIICTICNEMNSSKSGQEHLFYNIIKNNYEHIMLRNKQNIIPPLELDIYLPDLKLAFEFNGLYYHDETSKASNYHYNKTEICEAQGIHLVHIYEDDWIYKQEIVKSRILNLLGKNDIKLYARKCIIKEISDNSEVRDFLNTNHLQGFVGSQIKLGLYYNNELVSLMTFGKQRKSMGTKSEDNVYEMLRFCNKINTTVVGGANKLFNYFVKNYKPKEVISYADRSWSQGNLYKVLGFTYIHKTKPNYYYIVNGVRKYRFNYRKDILIKQGFDQNKSEHEIMLERKIYRIYDSGNLKYIYKLTI